MTEMLQVRRHNGNRTYRTERLYRCGNGLSLGAVKNGLLTLGDDDRPWEIFTIGPNGVPYGEPVGFVTDEQLDVAVERLSLWPFDLLAAS